MSSAEEKTRVTVDIFGTHYKLVGNSSVSYMKMVAAHVNDQMHRIADLSPRLDSAKIAVLAAVNVADEYYKLKNELESYNREQTKLKADLLEQQKLQDEVAQLRRELEKTRQQVNNTPRQDNEITEAYEKLKVEYEMLKREYNEWIELVTDKNEPNPN